jgi:hypothetical protein
MESPSMDLCSANTAPRTTDSRGRPLTHFPSEDMMCLRDSCGSLPSTTHCRSTVATTGRFKSHLYDIIAAPLTVLTSSARGLQSLPPSCSRPVSVLEQFHGGSHGRDHIFAGHCCIAGAGEKTRRCFSADALLLPRGNMTDHSRRFGLLWASCKPSSNRLLGVGIERGTCRTLGSSVVAQS